MQPAAQPGGVIWSSAHVLPELVTLPSASEAFVRHKQALHGELLWGGSQPLASCCCRRSTTCMSQTSWSHSLIAATGAALRTTSAATKMRTSDSSKQQDSKLPGQL